MYLLIIFLLALLIYSVLSNPIGKTSITPPIFFTSLGIATNFLFPELFQLAQNRSGLLVMAELGLVFLLFTDASRIDLKLLHSIGALPARLLSIGMLLTIGLGAVLAKLIFPSLTIWEAGILSAILAPTDAGLGQVIVTSEKVPLKVRQALNVEAGLNDGLSVPFMLFFIALAAYGIDDNSAKLGTFIGEQLGIGALIGLLVGGVGGLLIGRCKDRQLISGEYLQIAVMTLPLLCLPLCELAEASMFIASFVAGLATQIKFQGVGNHSVEFAEEWGQVLNQGVFFLFGMTVAHNWSDLSASAVLYAIASLTIVRMVPVAISLIGTGLTPSSLAFIGWFGPRGLASIVLGLVYLQQDKFLSGEPVIRAAVIATVFLSIFAHGLSAQPLLNLYSRKVRQLPVNAAEN